MNNSDPRDTRTVIDAAFVSLQRAMLADDGSRLASRRVECCVALLDAFVAHQNARFSEQPPRRLPSEILDESSRAARLDIHAT